MSYTAKDVQSLRQTTGAGMMDCKKALEENGGEIEAAKQWLREKGLAASAKRDDRENAQGVVAVIVETTRASIIKLKCETDFVASSDGFKAAADALAQSILEKGEAGLSDHSIKIDDLKITLKEKIEVGETIRFEAASGNALDFYNHIQGGRGVNGVIVEMSGATQEVAHDVAVHIAFARPRYLRREDVPADVVEKERATLEIVTRNEGKPEQAIAKVVEGRVNGFFKDICLLEQPYAKDDKLSIAQFIGSAQIVRFAQVEIG
ncbi:MAG: translation elongation factor Ts [Ilumatobacteraceae bacterium]|nr:translation elongation factor Ts [Ilumatobacteraceae bacterium]